LPASKLPNQNSYFIGRDNYLKKIDSFLMKENKKVVSLISMSGTGKSSIAYEYGYKFKKNGFVYCIKSDLGNVHLELINFASDIGIELTDQERQNNDLIISLIKTKLEYIIKNNEMLSFLFIFDNCDGYDQIENYITQLSDIKNVFIIITAIDKSFTKFDFIEIEPFNEEESIEFLRKKLESISETEITELIGFFDFKKNQMRPYALNKITAFIKLNIEKEIPLKSLIESMKSKDKQTYEEIIDNEFFNLIREQHENSIDVLEFISFMDPDFIPIDIFTELISIDEDNLDESVRFLKKLSLISIERKEEDLGVKIHRALQNETIQYLKLQESDYEQITYHYCASLITAICDCADQDESNIKWRNLKFYSNFKLITENCLAFPNLVKKIESPMFGCFGIYLAVSKFNFNEALIYLKKSIEINDEIANSGQNNYFDSLPFYFIGMIYTDIGENYKALEFYNKSLDIKKKKFNNDENKDIATILNNIGIIYSNLSEYEKALDYYNKSLEMYQKIYGTDENSTIALIWNNIANAYSRLGETIKALDYYQKSLKMYQKLDINTGTILNNIGNIYIENLEFQKALEYYNESLKVTRKIFGTDENKNIATTLHNIGRAYTGIKEYNEAFDYYKKSLEINIKIFGNDKNYDHATILMNIGMNYLGIYDYKEALNYLNKALEIDKMLFKTDENIAISTILDNIGMVYMKKGDYDKALDSFNESLKIERKIFDNDENVHIFLTLMNIGMVYRFTGKFEEAIKFLNDSLDVQSKINVKNKNNEIASILYNIGMIYNEMKEKQLAVDYLMRSLDIRLENIRLSGNNTDLNIFSIKKGISTIFMETDEHELAIVYLKKSEEIDKRLLEKEKDK